MRTRTIRRLTLATALQGALLAAVPGVANAQTTDTPRPSAGQDVVIVTARKKEETLQEAPLSVNVFGSEDIAELGVSDISELSNFAAGFTMEKFGGRRGAEGDTSRPVIRGQANILGETNAAVFVDGIPYSESFLSFPFDAIERVEVVKGPQAALFGRSTFAGAINVITKKGSNEFKNRLTGTVASQDEYELNVSSSGPIVEDKLFYFVQGRYYDYGGEYNNSIDGQSVGGESSWGINGALEYQASPDFSIIVRGGYNEDEDEVAAQLAQSRFYNNCFLDQARQYYCGAVQEFDEVTLDIAGLGSDAGLTREVSRVSATATWDIGGSGYTLTSNSGYTKSDSVFGSDATFQGDPNNFAGGTLVRVEIIDQAEWSSELRLDTPSENALRGSIGAFYYDREKDSFRRRPESTALIADFGNAYTQNQAVFGSLEYDFTDKMTGRAEVRYQEDTIGIDYGAGTIYEVAFDSVTPRFTLDYQATDDILIYGAVAKGNKPGYINSDPAVPDARRYADEEESWNYEVGFKSMWPSANLQLNGAVYYIDWTNQQLSDSIFIAGVPSSVVTNAGATEVKGFELESIWRPIDALSISTSYAFAEAQITDFCDPVQGAELTGFNCLNAEGIQGGQVAGAQIPNAPKHHFVLSTQYMQPLGANSDYDWFVRGDFSFTSKKFSQVSNLAHTGDRSLLNLKAGIKKFDSWDITFFVDNVLDDLTPATVVRYADLVNLNVGPGSNNAPGSTVIERAFLFPLAQGRQYGVKFGYDF